MSSILLTFNGLTDTILGAYLTYVSQGSNLHDAN